MVVVKMVGRDSAVLLVHGGRNVHCYGCASIIDVACNMLAVRFECSELYTATRAWQPCRATSPPTMALAPVVNDMVPVTGRVSAEVERSEMALHALDGVSAAL